MCIPWHVDMSEHEGLWETRLNPHVVQLCGGRESLSLSLWGPSLTSDLSQDFPEPCLSAAPSDHPRTPDFDGVGD